MGWDTQNSIIVEDLQCNVKIVAMDIFEADAKHYFHKGTAYAIYKQIENGSSVLFFTYERRKYLPYWAIQEVSKKHVGAYFTILASSLNFINGPGGLVKILNGEIIDSYGFWEERQSILNKPDAELLWQWFGKHKAEALIRERYLDTNPKRWVEDDYAANSIDFSPNEIESLQKTVEQVNREVEWEAVDLG